VHRVGYSRDKDELKEKWGKEDLGGRGEEEEEEANDSYPTCLAYLTLLQSPLFRERLRDPIFAKDIERLGSRHHETWYVLLPFPASFLTSSFLNCLGSSPIFILTPHPSF
jgi:hypothetical protein